MDLTMDDKKIITDVLYFKDLPISIFVYFTLFAFGFVIIHSILIGNWILIFGLVLAIFGWVGVLLSHAFFKEGKFIIHWFSLFIALTGTVLFVAGFDIQTAKSLAVLFGFLYLFIFFGMLVMPKEDRIP
jgi:hypothetical protein